MKYLCLNFYDEKERNALSEDESQTLIHDSLSFDKDLRGSGNLLAAHALDQVRTAGALRTRNGNVLVTDGPFAETKEQIAGFVVIETKDFDEAIHVAPRIPRRDSEALKCVPSSKDRHLNTGKMRPINDVQCHVQSGGDGYLVCRP